MDLTAIGVIVCTGLSLLRLGTSRHDNKSSGSIKAGTPLSPDVLLGSQVGHCSVMLARNKLKIE